MEKQQCRITSSKCTKTDVSTLISREQNASVSYQIYEDAISIKIVRNFHDAWYIFRRARYLSMPYDLRGFFGFENIELLNAEVSECNTLRDIC